MNGLTSAERELVALGAALGSNCVPCIEYHIPEARKAGLSERQISEAIDFADKVRQVPAKKVLETARGLLRAEPIGETSTAQSSAKCAPPWPPPDRGAGHSCCG